MSDNTIPLLAELLELTAAAPDPDLVLAEACTALRDQQGNPRAYRESSCY